MNQILIEVKSLSSDLGLKKYFSVIENDFDVELICPNPKTYKLVPRDVEKEIKGKKLNFREVTKRDGPQLNFMYKKYIMSSLKDYIRNPKDVEVQIE
jgi:hypothetical protein